VREATYNVPENIALMISAYVGSRKVGFITLRNKISVGFIDVHPSMQRCGLGTRLYEKAAKIACEEAGVGLQSDIERTTASQGFWNKQVAKGRAHCVEPASDEMEQYIDRRKQQGIAPTGEEEITPSMGRGGCYFFKLQCPAPKSLAGKRRRR
jgi:GNAT superfamily N-acetyltransferase